MSKTSGAQIGNENATKNKPWAAAIQRALNKQSLKAKADALEEIANALIAKAKEGDIQALKEIGDRVDGKATQTLDTNIRGNLTVEIVKFAE